MNAALRQQSTYHLKPGTLAVNGGDNSFYSYGRTPDLSSITTDADGNPRIQGTSIDLGAYEVVTSNVSHWELY